MRRARLTALAVLLALTATAAAGPTRTTETMPEAVEQTIADVTALSRSLREIEEGLRQPTGFQGLYRVWDDPDRLMRVQGGLYAVFDRSRYAIDDEGRVFPTVPDGTVFYIGPVFEPPAPPAPSAFPDRIDARLDSRLAADLRPAPRVAPRDDHEPPPPAARRRPAAGPLPSLPRIVADEAYRARRMRALMLAAAHGRRRHAESAGAHPVE